MFNSYRLKDTKTGDVVHLGKLSYLWACLLGPIYVAFKAGPSCIPRSLVLSLSCAGLFLVLLINLNRVPEAIQAVVLIFGVIALALLHSLKSISFIVNFYRKQRGRWTVRID